MAHKNLPTLVNVLGIQGAISAYLIPVIIDADDPVDILRNVANEKRQEMDLLAHEIRQLEAAVEELSNGE